MKIIIPMTGIGKRFIDAGYTTPKPLIEVDGKPIIEHVVSLFPGEKDIIFICNTKHLQETNLREVLNRIAPSGKIVEISPHKKGPVYAVYQLRDMIDDDEEVIVNYCDFGTYWDYKDFLKHTRERNADGAIPSYKGFHPHMLGKINYAFMRDNKQWMLEIREKQPFTDNRMNEYASNGTYYFKKGSYVKKYFKQLMDEDINLKGEYYVSMIYNLMVQDGLKVSIYEIQHMQQWGTPGELEEYVEWSEYFTSLTKPKENNKVYDAIKLIPLAGRGQRFQDAGYKNPKPLIEVSGKPMIIQASEALPKCNKNIFVCLKEHLDKYPLKEELLKVYPDAKIIALDKVTEGQACTCEIGLKDEDLEKPLFIGACDNSMILDYKKLEKATNEADVLAFTFKNNPASEKNPNAYGWVKVDENDNATGVSVKIPISDTPKNDNAIVGAFYFKKAKYFIDALNYLYENNIRVNNEFYVDSCVDAAIKLGRKVKVFTVDKYICWGTPDDYKSFIAYQSLFHKLGYHKYSLDKDRDFNQDKFEEYDTKYRHFEQENR